MDQLFSLMSFLLQFTNIINYFKVKNLIFTLLGSKLDAKSQLLSFITVILYLGLVVTKPIFGVSDKAILKPVSSATETS